ncbi:uncharacterized protein LOC125551390 [Triticum urartu]|uniref:uncharacterized protein LOC125551390 n=1 Tax=Triticum urartu TaxID=4572 RepID=UPI0020435866|nr:uncharacterized protein LOC125551390 [Triticum urartu]
MGQCVCSRLMHPRLPYSDDRWTEVAPGPIRRWPWLRVSSRSGFARALRSPCGTCKRVKTLAASSRQARGPSASSPPYSLLSHAAALEPAPPPPHLLPAPSSTTQRPRCAEQGNGLDRGRAGLAAAAPGFAGRRVESPPSPSRVSSTVAARNPFPTRKIPRDLIDGGITIWRWIIHFCSTSNVVFVWNGQFSISKSAILYFLSGYIILLGFSLYVAQK